MGHIFISYSHKDTDYAHGLANNLQSIGFDVWIDERLDYGSQWPHEIQKQLDTCDAFILVMSPRSFASEWVQSELQRAKRKLKSIFPLLLEGDEPWLSVESTQYYDVRGGRFPDARFYSAIKRVVSINRNSQTFQGPKKSAQVKPIANSSAPKYKTEIITAVIGAVATICAACATVFAQPLMNILLPDTVPPTSPPTLTPFTSPTSQPTLYSSPTLLPTEILTSTLTPTPLPTLTPLPTQTPIPPPTATPVLVSKVYYIEKHNGVPGTQSSDPLDYTIDIVSVDLLQVEISIKGPKFDYDSDIFVHIYLDGIEIKATPPIGLNSGRQTTGLIDISGFISPGVHTLKISPEGILGGSNTGSLYAWGADLFVYTNEYH